MDSLARQRCFNHEHREAVARCPECTRYFCRECITEHDDRVLCAGCLAKLLQPSFERPRPLRGLLRFIHFIAGFTVLWVFFYYLGRILLSLPTEFHEGTLWESGWWGNK